MAYERDGVAYATYGEYLRSKSLKVAYCKSHIGHDATAQKKWDQEIDLYRAATRQGIQPAGTSTAKTMQALKLSERHGMAYDAGDAEGFARTVLGVKPNEVIEA